MSDLSDLSDRSPCVCPIGPRVSTQATRALEEAVAMCKEVATSGQGLGGDAAFMRAVGLLNDVYEAEARLDNALLEQEHEEDREVGQRGARLYFLLTCFSADFMIALIELLI